MKPSACKDAACADIKAVIGGPPGYAEFVAALADPEHERHEELLTWFGGVFDAEGFDLNRVNRELRRLRKR
jgi:hypothetical protein